MTFKVQLQKKKVQGPRLPSTAKPITVDVDARSMKQALDHCHKNITEYDVISIEHPSGAIYK